MLSGMLMFTLNDTMGKWLVGIFPIGQVILLRSIAALIVLAPFVWKIGVRPLISVDRPLLQISRVVLSTAEVSAFYFAVAYMPLADVMTYWLASPIYVAALSPFLLGERVGWRRWTAIAIGFVGVMVALEPSKAVFSAPALISIFGSMAFAFMMITARSLRGTPDTVLVFWQTLGAGVAGLATIPFAWVPPAASDVALLALLGVVSMTAHVLVNRAFKLADAAIVAPLQYTQLFWAIIFGYIFFHDLPSATMMAGAALIVASGLFIFFRENKLKKGAVAADRLESELP
ncbi:DMT family transporter [Rhizobium alvei]|uniref:DMT family transporter n=2 Tax=Rhizobium alvei TaxID=1132659 RepID=A0ABT8YIU9_9HYPH|nr:DMT family transporter [Rhizobium alvei]MDO6963367.1 DMT family transporter [Rhizobium alvei]